MRRLLHALPALALLTLPLLPAATATAQCVAAPAGVVCAGDFDHYEGCQEPWSFKRETTGVFASTGVASASAGGSHDCSRVCLPFGCFMSESRGVFAEGAVVFVGSASLHWRQGSTCTTSAQVVTAAGLIRETRGCPAGPPPDLPWGHVLP